MSIWDILVYSIHYVISPAAVLLLLPGCSALPARLGVITMLQVVCFWMIKSFHNQIYFNNRKCFTNLSIAFTFQYILMLWVFVNIWNLAWIYGMRQFARPFYNLDVYEILDRLKEKTNLNKNTTDLLVLANKYCPVTNLIGIRFFCK